MSIPADLRYTRDHEWTQADGDGLKVGITAFAADQLGSVVFVELPAIGTVLKAGEAFGQVESTKSVSDLYAPVSGTVTDVNTALEDAPELINEAPYAAGWMLVLKPIDATEVDGLLDALAEADVIAA